MTRNFRRSLTAAAGVLALGTALVACSPPHENDSEKKVDTATSAAAPKPQTHNHPTESAAASTSAQATGSDKEATIVASANQNIVEGQEITLNVSGLNPQSGYYAAICSATAPHGSPAPLCTGQHSDATAQAWIKAGGMGTTPLNADGTATVTLRAASTGQGLDCKTDTCVLKVFGDHTEGFRDVAKLPVTFAS
ncbi:hypothetical protein [Corynebacterium pseudotuberculosis]|uniref:Thiamine biosynthesis protein n=1 Tax=Corynebacterium pseudotuberculosis (strain C231) TaxID=681645 RepID=D9QBP6_CORP2|nr:hypothetical protein [Corynebacterium pseudotuberculosis]ADK29306.1 thiamine biosynthesis protein [Corynebacterium pseudotuberculosis FRC41]ADL10972.1 thiamine biosynthesis protein [Corynebacterium pseudotuberculosis C231]ADL21373.1 thiamine biosynthesis protein [Corynebacterium pseudotuberculosis 1002]ADO26772.1 thiamine biosynthesis protein [Corynebacterium pseudotuberculosis I19]AEK92837.1 Thiamine biosynthesis protein X [Corynebacterium pseudotuberculosis PAT10]